MFELPMKRRRRQWKASCGRGWTSVLGGEETGGRELRYCGWWWGLCSCERESNRGQIGVNDTWLSPYIFIRINISLRGGGGLGNIVNI